MSKKYRLIKELNIDYERDRGYRPSGYAKLSLSLIPFASEENIVSIDFLHREKWAVRETVDALRYYGNISPEEIENMYIPFAQMISEGVKKGSLRTLEMFLEKPVSGVIVRLNRATFDLVYSTKISFELAAEEATEILLRQAKDEGLLENN